MQLNLDLFWLCAPLASEWIILLCDETTLSDKTDVLDAVQTSEFM